MKQFLITAMLISMLRLSASATDEVPGRAQEKPVALVNAVIHPVTSPIVEGTLLFRDGKVSALGKKVRVPDDAVIIDLRGRHVYPGMVEAHSQLGLKEISAVRASRDDRETGSLNPNVQANVAVNPDSEAIPVTRANGILTTLSAPSGGRISGFGSVMNLDGWTYEDMTVRARAALIVDWPSPPSSGESPGLKILRRVFTEARAYRRARSVPNSTQRHDIRYEAMFDVLDGSVPVMALAHDVREIQAAVSFSVEQNIRLIIFGGHDAVLCSALLKEHDIPVVVDSVHRTPRRRYEAYDYAYTLPDRLRRAGIRFCISGSETNSTWNARNLPYHAAMAVAHGLPMEDAIRAVTISPAEIMGVADQVGSLEPGKDATLIVTDGNPLEITSHVRRAWIRGRPVQLTSRHTRLNDKYRQKYRQKAVEAQQAGD